MKLIGSQKKHGLQIYLTSNRPSNLVVKTSDDFSFSSSITLEDPDGTIVATLVFETFPGTLPSRGDVDIVLLKKLLTTNTLCLVIK